MEKSAKISLEPASNSQGGVDVKVPLATTSGRYYLWDFGLPERPDIKHDNGFLDAFPPEKPTEKDIADYNRWLWKARGAWAACRPVLKKLVPQCDDEDQREAIEAYLHYLGNTGTTRIIPYNDFLVGDENGRAIEEKILDDIKVHIEAIGKNRQKFRIISGAIPVGLFTSTDKRPPYLNGYYPSSINWKRTIGTHYIWVSADVNIKILGNGNEILYDSIVTINMEDMYNFNPGGLDITTKIPDSENGRFQIVGLAKQYLNKGSATRNLTWKKPVAASK